MTVRSDGIVTRQKLLDATIKLFIEKGFTATRTKDICDLSGAAVSSFNNAYRTKEGILYALVGFMFKDHFAKARQIAGEDASPATIYAVESAIQLATVELRETLRDVYLAAYTLPSTSESIFKNTATELYSLFGAYMPEAGEGDFYELEIASGSVMRGYMAVPCNPYFTLEKKMHRFLTVNFAIYHVPEEEQRKAFDFLASLKVQQLAGQIIDELTQTIEAGNLFPEDEIT